MLPGGMVSAWKRWSLDPAWRLEFGDRWYKRKKSLLFHYFISDLSSPKEAFVMPWLSEEAANSKAIAIFVLWFMFFCHKLTRKTGFGVELLIKL